MTRPYFTSFVLCGLLALGPVEAVPQTHKVAAPEKVTRAIAIYEWTGDLAKPTATRLIPVSLFINGNFEDAAVYLSRPVPLALESGNVYSIDQAGVSHGTYDLTTAARLTAGNTDASFVTYDATWLGYGRFVPPPIIKVTPLKPSKNLPVVVGSNDPDRPHMVNRSPAAGSTPSTPSRTSRTPSDTTTDSGNTSSTTSDNDPDRPTLRKRSPTEQKQAQKDAEKSRNQSSVSSPSMSLNDDPDRPTLHRNAGVPGSTEDKSRLVGMPADLHQTAAVSDPANRLEHPFSRAWDDENEHAVILAQMQAMAREQLAAYTKANPLPAVASTQAGVTSHASTAATPTDTQTAAQALTATDQAPPKLQRRSASSATPPSTTATTPVSTPAPAKASTSVSASSKATTSAKANTTSTAHMTPAQRRKAAAAAAAAAKLPPPSVPLLDEQLRGYTLSYGGSPTFIYTAHTVGTGAAERFITLVAQMEDTASDDANNHKLLLALHSVTDAAHLDRAPELRLIDAVDADGSNRASLLFELRNQGTRQFGLYRVLSGRSEQIFLTGTTQ